MPVSIAAVLAVTALSQTLPRTMNERQFTYHYENVLGTALELRIVAAGVEQADAARLRALAEIDRLEAIFSTYRPDSELNRWLATRGESLAISEELIALLERAERWRNDSAGAFDARVAALSRLWSKCARDDRLPTDAQIGESLELMKAAAWSIDGLRSRATRLGACPITLDAIAKGYIAERAVIAAYAPADGIADVLINLGGDLGHRGKLTHSLGIAPAVGDSETAEAEARIAIQNVSVATSGNAQRGFRINDRWYSHILDPRIGRPAEQVLQATVIAPDGADADALATICNVLTPDESLRLVESKRAACRIVTRSGQVLTSRLWAHFTEPADDPKRAQPNPTTPHWSDTHELAIPFVINRPEAARYRRPYVVIWIENSEGVSVRTLILWVSLGGSGPDQWLPDLARWYRGDAQQSSTQRKNMVQTIARPTRQPGRHSVVWDGKDDAGKHVDAGSYTVFIEAAREHGTHQLIRKTVSVGGSEFSEELTGNVEIASARIEYRRKPKPE